MSALVIVANRFPVQPPTRGRGPWRTCSPGGLAEALHRALQPVAAPGSGGPVVGQPWGFPTDLGYDLHPVQLDAAIFVATTTGSATRPCGRSTTTSSAHPVPPGLVGCLRPCQLALRRCGRESAPPGAEVWVHDYHLQLVPSFVRERRPDLRIGFFLHIPFPPRTSSLPAVAHRGARRDRWSRSRRLPDAERRVQLLRRGARGSADPTDSEDV